MAGERNLILVSFPEEQRDKVITVNNSIEGVRVVEPLATYQHELFTFDIGERVIYSDSHSIELTAREVRLMQVLTLLPNKSVSRRDLAKFIFDSDYFSDSDTNNIGQLVWRLRSKLKKIIGDHDLIKTVHGFGYALIDESRPHHQEPTASSREQPTEPMYLRAKSVFTG